MSGLSPRQTNTVVACMCYFSHKTIQAKIEPKCWDSALTSCTTLWHFSQEKVMAPRDTLQHEPLQIRKIPYEIG